MKYLIGLVITAMLTVGSGVLHGADETFKPFVLASVNDSTLEAQSGEVISDLTAAGFEVVGQYSPMEGTHILVATHEALKNAAARSDRGGYAAGQRISLTETENGIEVSYVNPTYIQHAYRLEADLRDVSRKLADALGKQRSCGAGDKKMTARKLQKYNYMIGMQKFDDPSELGRFGSYEEAVAAVEQGLAREGDGLSQVYRIDIPGKQQTVFGVGMRSVSEDDEHIDETFQMGIVDFEGCSKKAYLPYEVLVNGNEVEALHMRFRMAVHFPNLSMMGKQGFTKLMPFPSAIEDALEAMVSQP